MSAYVKVWEHSDSPVLWVEMIYVGDTRFMKKYFGFSYVGHVFTSKNQKTTFFRNTQSERLAEVFGLKKYSRKNFINKFLNESKREEKNLRRAVRNIVKVYNIQSDAELGKLFLNFFESYSSLMAFYRFCRPEFYEKVIMSLPKKAKSDISKIGKRRFEMHGAWMNAYKESLPLLKEIGKRKGLSLIEIQNCTSDEILGNKKIEKVEIKKRVKKFTFEYQKTSFRIYSEIYPPKIKITNSEQIKGVTACQGFARGKVSVIKESLLGSKKYELEKLKKGDILVTEMTSPDMMLAIKNAAAIVTDDGGILCHAAIISRELKIPCIVGTKIATKALKDNDFVEVDANKGTVTILK